MSFERILGQDTAVLLLEQALRSGRVGSGYLFYGPDGVGKGLAADAFARALLCDVGAEEGGACGTCPACIRSAAESHPGFHRVRREGKTTQILIAQIHELGARLSLRPVEGSRQVVVLSEMERTGEAAFNALLKTLEEPPPGATLILTTSNREAIPETIRSRCQAVRFRPLALEHVRRIMIERLGRSEDEAEMLAPLSGGSMSRVERILALDLSGEDAREVLAARDARDDSALAGAWIRMVPGGNGEERRGRVDTLLRVLMEGVRKDLTAAAPPAGIGTRMRLLSKALEDNRLNLSAELILRSLAVGWVDSLAEVDG